MIPRAPITRRAFTIAEVIVVVVIIAIVAGLVAPRVGNLSRRAADNQARAVFALLASVAQRDAMSSQAYALAFDPGSSRLGLLALVENPDPLRPGPPQWRPAPGQSPLTLDALDLRAISLDGQVLSGGWTVEFHPAQPRPAISILLAQRDDPDAEAWQVDLDPSAMAAALTTLESPALWSPPAANTVDLDAAAGRTTPW